MNNESIIKSIIYILLFVGLPVVFYFLAKKISNATKFKGRKRILFLVMVTSIISLIFFYSYSFLLNYCNVNIEYLNFCTLIYIPLSFIVLLASSIIFIFNYRQANAIH